MANSSSNRSTISPAGHSQTSSPSSSSAPHNNNTTTPGSPANHNHSRNSKIMTRSVIHNLYLSNTNTTSTNNNPLDSSACSCSSFDANVNNKPLTTTRTLSNNNAHELELINDDGNNDNNDNNYDDYIMDTDDEENGHAQWARLPQEILTKIFCYLTICDTEMVECTCTAWNRACNSPSLWRRVVFNFDGTDSIRLMADALRLISSKGHFMRDLVLTIGSPGLNQAWMMSGCIQQLLDFICQSPCHSIETFRISNLVIFTQNRFFKLSKESILNSLNNFLRSQKNLKSVSFSSCKFSPGEGLKILRTLKCFRSSLKRLELHDFFKRRYVSASKAFKIISTLTSLEDVSVDADYINDKILMWLVEKWPNRKPLRHLKIYFEALRPPPTAVSKECWMAARQCFQEMKVSYHIGGILHYQWMTPFLIPAVPLVECVIYWNYFRRGPVRYYAENLTNLITSLATRQSTFLERFSLTSDMRSFPELEDALALLVSSCPRLTDVSIEVNLLSSHVTDSISAMLGFRTRPVAFRFQTSVQTDSRHRGVVRSRGR